MKNALGGLALAMMVSGVGLVGCGGGAGGSPDGGGGAGAGGASGGGTMTWKEGGVLHTAIYPSGARVKSAQLDMVQVSGGDAGGAAVSFGVSMKPPLTVGTFSCGVVGASGPIVSLAYVSKSATTSGGATCTITLTTVGDTTGTHAIGTFSASTPLSTGTTAVITEGKFDVPLTVSSI
jgi:hypothetical protein